MPDFSTKVFNSASQASPLGEAIVQYLQRRNALPAVEEGYLGDGVLGQFSRNTAFGANLPKNGLLTLPFGWDPRSGVSTAVHELAHAADNQLAEQYLALPYASRQQNQFGNAFQKLVLNSKDGKSSRNMLAEALGGRNFAKSRQDYRASSAELAAFGAGSTVKRNEHSPAPLHVDPTMATELAILLDLAMRNRPSK